MFATDRIEALRAGLIVPLVWEDLGDGTWVANTPFGNYSIIALAWSRAQQKPDVFNLALLTSIAGEFDTLELAQAAAQSDYSTRSLSALHPDLDAMLALMAEAVGALQIIAEQDDAGDMLYRSDGPLAKIARAVIAKIAGGAE